MFKGLLNVQFRSKTQPKYSKICNIERFTKWLSYFYFFRFWPPKVQNLVFTQNQMLTKYKLTAYKNWMYVIKLNSNNKQGKFEGISFFGPCNGKNKMGKCDYVNFFYNNSWDFQFSCMKINVFFKSWDTIEQDRRVNIEIFHDFAWHWSYPRLNQKMNASIEF